MEEYREDCEVWKSFVIMLYYDVKKKKGLKKILEVKSIKLLVLPRVENFFRVISYSCVQEQELARESKQ